MLVKLAPPFVLTCHCTVGVGVPLAAAVKVTLPPVMTLLTGFSVTAGGESTVTVALPMLLAEQPIESVADETEYVVVDDGWTVKVSGLEPVLVPPPLLSVTLYGAVPPLSETVTVAEPPGQMVPPPLTVAVVAVSIAMV